MTFTALLTVRVTPEALPDAAATIDSVLDQTRAFDGSEGVELLQDADDPHRFIAIERWASRAHDDAYRAWRTTDAGRSALGPLLAEAPELTFWESV
jgi:heme oxygenase (mycobilin-producing)